MRRLAALFGVIFCVMAALLVLISTGLPDRTRFTGQWVDNLYIAPEIGEAAPPFDLPRIDGTILNWQDLQNQPVVINFWATWCEPCRAEMPILQAFHQRTGIRVLAVNTGEPPDIIQHWVEELQLTFDVVVDTDGMVQALYRLRGQPSTFIVSSDGLITHIFYGAVSESILEMVFEP
jgi:thiol-disulfide isomerase/thioredoxin